MKSSIKVWISLSFLALLILGLSYYFFNREGLLWGIVLSIFLLALIYFYGDKGVLSRFAVKNIEGQDPWQLVELTQQMANRAGLPCPSVNIIPVATPTAFSVGRTWSQGRIVLSEGLIEALSKDEIQAVLAHEIARIKRLDTLAFSVSGSIACVLLSMTASVDQKLIDPIRKKMTRRRDTQSDFLSLVMAPFVAIVARSTLTAGDYYAVDQMAVQWLDDKKLLAQALWKLNSYSATKPMKTPLSLAHIFIVNPLTSRGWPRYFLLQPPVECRIQKIVGYYPI